MFLSLQCRILCCFRVLKVVFIFRGSLLFVYMFCALLAYDAIVCVLYFFVHIFLLASWKWRSGWVIFFFIFVYACFVLFLFVVAVTRDRYLMLTCNSWLTHIYPEFVLNHKRTGCRPVLFMECNVWHVLSNITFHIHSIIVGKSLYCSLRNYLYYSWWSLGT
jgi:hypothetical protein